MTVPGRNGARGTTRPSQCSYKGTWSKRSKRRWSMPGASPPNPMALVNPPVVRGSTVLHASVAAKLATGRRRLEPVEIYGLVRHRHPFRPGSRHRRNRGRHAMPRSPAPAFPPSPCRCSPTSNPASICWCPIPSTAPPARFCDGCCAATVSKPLITTRWPRPRHCARCFAPTPKCCSPKAPAATHSKSRTSPRSPRWRMRLGAKVIPRQHLGHPSFPALHPWRRRLDPGPDKIPRRPFRHHSRRCGGE